MNAADIIANGANLAFVLFIFMVLLNTVIKNKVVHLVLMIIVAISLLFVRCYHGMSIIDLLRGIVGDLSISGLLFLICYAIIHYTKIPINLFDRTFCLIIVLIGAFLYLSVLDIIPFDIYRLGYLPHSLLPIIFLFVCFFY